VTVLITQEYASEFATLNSLWAAARQRRFVPKDVHVFTPDATTDRARRLVDQIGVALQALGVEKPVIHLVPVKIDDFAAIRNEALRLIKKAQMEARKVAVDVTPGRTVAKLALFDAARSGRPDHVFYLDVAGYDYRDLPYPLVPARIQRARDLSEEGLADD